jgi:hypothetical protein
MFIALDSGTGSTCAIRVDGRLACWGFIGGAVPKGQYESVSVGETNACAIRREDSAVVCWMSPEDEEEEDEEDEEEAGVPESATRPPGGPVTAVSVGEEYSCAIKADARLACWAPWPDELPSVGDRGYLAVDLPCAIQVGGALECFSSDSMSGSGPPVDGTYTAVSATTEGGRGCALRSDSTLACWGDEGYDDQDNERMMRTPAGTYEAVTVGETEACAIRPDGTAVCWGEWDESARPAPTMLFHAPVWHAELDIPLRWGALPAFGPIVSYDIDAETGRDAEGLPTGFTPWRVATTSVEGTYPGTPGESNCWRARVRDTDQRVSEWGGGCTTLPHDDKVLERSGGWSTVRDDRYYLGRATTATKRGAELTIDVDTGSLGILATTCPSCGTIEIYVGGELSETVSLRTKKRHDRRLVYWSDNGEGGFFQEDGYGHIVIKVASSGRRVTIDGVLQGAGPVE